MLHKFNQLLEEELKNIISEEKKKLLPRGFQRIGDIIMIQLKPELLPLKKEIAKAIIKKIPNTRAVCLKKGEIIGEFRRPQIELLEGESTETIHSESNCFFKLDVAKVMYSKGNQEEKRRLAKLVKPGETIIDFFAGIGYFTIPIAVLASPKKVYSIEKNKEAFYYLKENILLNKVEEKVTPIHGDCVVEAPKIGEKADRIIMGLLPAPSFALPTAIECIKPMGTIHYEGIAFENELPNKLMKDVEKAAEEKGRKAELIKLTLVKSFAPKRFHAVVDARIY